MSKLIYLHNRDTGDVLCIPESGREHANKVFPNLVEVTKEESDELLKLIPPPPPPPQPWE